MEHPIAGVIQPAADGPCSGYQPDGRSEICAYCDWPDSSHTVAEAVERERRRLVSNLEAILYAIPADGTPTTFRWNHGRLEIQREGSGWHELPMQR